MDIISLMDIILWISYLYHPGLNKVEPFDENEHRISLLKFHKKEATVRPAEFVCVCLDYLHFDNFFFSPFVIFTKRNSYTKIYSYCG